MSNATDAEVKLYWMEKFDSCDTVWPDRELFAPGV